jgi:hypothetical protein
VVVVVVVVLFDFVLLVDLFADVQLLARLLLEWRCDRDRGLLVPSALHAVAFVLVVVVVLLLLLLLELEVGLAIDPDLRLADVSSGDS